MTEVIVLDKYDGLPSAWLEKRWGRINLNWIVIGHEEPFTVKLVVQLKDTDIPKLLDADTTNFDHFISSLAGRKFRVELHVDDVMIRSNMQRIDEHERSVTHNALTELAHVVRALERAHSRRAKVARDYEPILQTQIRELSLA